MAKGLDPKVMQDVALIVLVKTIVESPAGSIRLSKEDFARVDAMNPEDKWTIDVDKTGDVLISLVAKGS
jgi:hypothetical protein